MSAIVSETSRELDHFLRLAVRGARGGIGSGTVAAYQIATALLDYAPSLDGQALAGLVQFLDLAKYAPETAASLVHPAEGFVRPRRSRPER
jgi:hypothetical protein